MARRGEGAVHREIGRLFGRGTESGLTDARLIERFLDQGDPDGAESAFAALVERHGSMVRRVCARILADPSDLPDAVQATFFVLARRAGCVRDRWSTASWLHGVAVRVSRKANETAATRHRHERRRAEDAPTSYQADFGEARELFETLHREIEHLPERLRSAVVLCDLQGLTYEQAAARVGCPAGTIKSRLSAARRRLRDRLGGQGLFSTAAVPVAATLPPGFADATAREALRSLEPGAAATVAAGSWGYFLAEGVLRIMMWRVTTGWILAGVLMATSAGSGAAWAFRGQGQGLDQTKHAPSRTPDEPINPGETTRLRAITALERALAATEEMKPSWDKVWVRTGLAAAQARLDDPAGSRESFRKATDEVRTVLRLDDQGKRAGMAPINEKGILASIQYAAGDRDAADALAHLVLEEARELPADYDRLAGPSPRGDLLSSLALLMARAGAKPLAIEAASAIPDAADRAEALAMAGATLLSRGDVAGAVEALDLAQPAAKAAVKAPPLYWSRDDTFMRLADALADLAVALVESGDRVTAAVRAERAGAWADLMTSWQRADTIARVAMARRKVGDEATAREGFAEALRIAEEIRHVQDRTRNERGEARPKPSTIAAGQLCRIAQAQIESGDRDGGLATLRKAVADAEAAGALAEPSMQYELSQAWAAAGRREEALRLAPSGESSRILESIARRQAEAGEDREALEWASARTDPADRANALLGVARGILARQGRR